MTQRAFDHTDRLSFVEPANPDAEASFQTGFQVPAHQGFVIVVPCRPFGGWKRWFGLSSGPAYEPWGAAGSVAPHTGSEPQASGAENGNGGDVLQVADLRIDKAAHRVRVKQEEVLLTALEFRLLVTLIERRDHVLSRGALLSDVWGVSERNSTRTVDTHVKRLRDKLGGAAAFIQTVRGVGYRFSARPSAQRVDGRCGTRDQPRGRPLREGAATQT